MPDYTEGCVFNIQRYSLDDGAGIRTCVFLKGCPLTCLWCHNTESNSFKKEMFFTPSACIGCMACAAVCPNGCHSLSETGKHIYNRANCGLCGLCESACPTGALEVAGKTMTAGEVMKKVLRDRVFFGKNGGLTVTGGEPMSQFSFTLALCTLAKENGISTVIETSGFGKTEDFLKIAAFVDCFYFDCKADSDLHVSLTGVSDELILQNLSALSAAGAKIVLRCPIVPGANLTDAFLEKIIRLSNDFDAIGKITLLPYHNTGVNKTTLLGKEKQVEFTVPKNIEMDLIRQRVQKGVRVPVD